MPARQADRTWNTTCSTRFAVTAAQRGEGRKNRSTQDAQDHKRRKKNLKCQFSTNKKPARKGDETGAAEGSSGVDGVKSKKNRKKGGQKAGSIPSY